LSFAPQQRASPATIAQVWLVPAESASTSQQPAAHFSLPPRHWYVQVLPMQIGSAPCTGVLVQLWLHSGVPPALNAAWSTSDPAQPHRITMERNLFMD